MTRRSCFFNGGIKTKLENPRRKTAEKLKEGIIMWNWVEERWPKAP